MVQDSVPSRPMFTCDTTQDRHIRSEYVHTIGIVRLGTKVVIIVHK